MLREALVLIYSILVEINKQGKRKVLSKTHTLSICLDLYFIVVGKLEELTISNHGSQWMLTVFHVYSSSTHDIICCYGNPESNSRAVPYCRSKISVHVYMYRKCFCAVSSRRTSSELCTPCPISGDGTYQDSCWSSHRKGMFTVGVHRPGRGPLNV